MSSQLEIQSSSLPLLIDPLAAFLPPKLWEKFHPHQIKVADIVGVLQKATPAEREDTAKRTAIFAEYVKFMGEALASFK